MKIEGIPDGWELVEIGVPKAGDWMISAEGEPYQVICDYCTFWPIIRKIEKPNRYRPFANAAEAESLWNAVLKYKNPSPDREGSRYRIDAITKCGVSVVAAYYSYTEAFETYECSDGTPFGVEVIDD